MGAGDGMPGKKDPYSRAVRSVMFIPFPWLGAALLYPLLQHVFSRMRPTPVWEMNEAAVVAFGMVFMVSFLGVIYHILISVPREMEDIFRVIAEDGYPSPWSIPGDGDRGLSKEHSSSGIGPKSVYRIISTPVVMFRNLERWMLRHAERAVMVPYHIPAEKRERIARELNAFYRRDFMWFCAYLSFVVMTAYVTPQSEIYCCFSGAVYLLLPALPVIAIYHIISIEGCWYIRRGIYYYRRIIDAKVFSIILVALFIALHTAALLYLSYTYIP